VSRRGILVLAIAIPSAVLSALWIVLIINGSASADWRTYVEASQRVRNGGLYEVTDSYGFRASPVLAWAFALIAPIGPSLWRLLHIGAALAMPTWPLRLAVLVAWPFWFDVQHGNLLTFELLAAAWALRGSRAASLAYLALTLLTPRPLLLPIAGWLLWRREELRVPFLAMFALHAIAVFATGWGIEWLGQLVASTEEVRAIWNLGPSRLIGLWWLLAGVPLGLWLMRRGRLGLASLAFSPYWLPYYLLFALLDLPGARSEWRTRQGTDRIAASSSAS
jgi:hypothetical protein